jgi:hypothetical protein
LVLLSRTLISGDEINVKEFMNPELFTSQFRTSKNHFSLLCEKRLKNIFIRTTVTNYRSLIDQFEFALAEMNLRKSIDSPILTCY